MSRAQAGPQTQKPWSGNVRFKECREKSSLVVIFSFKKKTKKKTRPFGVLLTCEEVTHYQHTEYIYDPKEKEQRLQLIQLYDLSFVIAIKPLLPSCNVTQH